MARNLSEEIFRYDDDPANPGDLSIEVLTSRETNKAPEYPLRSIYILVGDWDDSGHITLPIDEAVKMANAILAAAAKT